MRLNFFKRVDIFIVIFAVTATSFVESQNTNTTASSATSSASSTITASSISTKTSSTTSTTTTPDPIPAKRPPSKPETDKLGKTLPHCVANGTVDSFKTCNYKITEPPAFKLLPCPRVASLANCTAEENGFGNCMVCVTALNSGSPKPQNGRIEIVSDLIPETGPQCQLRVRVASEGSSDLGAWKVFVRRQAGDELAASLFGSYTGEIDLVAHLPSQKDIAIVVVAEQWTNFTGRKAIGSINFEFCNFSPVSTEKSDFTCANGRSVSWAVVCDFVDDCGDSSDEKPETAGCGHRTEHCMFPAGCPFLNGWNPIDGRIIPRLGGLSSDGFMPPPPSIADGVQLPSITDDARHPNGLPLVVDLSAKMLRSDDAFVFNLPEIDAIRDVSDKSTRCWLRFHYYVPTGIRDVEFLVLDAGRNEYLVANLVDVASTGWVREQIELPLYPHISELTSNTTNLVEFYKPQIRIQYRDRNRLQPQTQISENGQIGIWGLSFSHGCRPVHTYCPTLVVDRASVGCRKDELSCSFKTPFDLSTLVKSVFMPDDGHPKDFCYPPLKKCDFTCDCPDCSDEANCGGTCDFAYPETCGWQTGDNWLWPPADKAICNGQPCIVTTPDALVHLIPATDFLPTRALVSNMFEWLNPNGCIMKFQYRLWPGTGLSLNHLSSNGASQKLWSDRWTEDKTGVTSWQMGNVNFSNLTNLSLSKFRLSFVPESTDTSLPWLGNHPVGIAKVAFSPECGAPSPKSITSCPPKAAVCQMGSATSECTDLIEQPIYACNQELVSCNNDTKDRSCTWQQPSSDEGSQPEIATTELFRFFVDEQFCNRGSCFALVNYDLHDDQSPSAFLALVLEERDVAATFGENGTVTRRQRLWQVAASDAEVMVNRTMEDYYARIPINYCPSDLTAQTKRMVSVQFEGTTGADNLKIELMRVFLTRACFDTMSITSGSETICRDGYHKCKSDQRCYPKPFICGSNSKPSFVSQMCPSEKGEANENGFDVESDCLKTASLPPFDTKQASTSSWSGARIAGVVVGVLASIILVVLASYAITKRVIKWYRSGGGHRSVASRSNGHDNNGSSSSSPFARNDGHHFRQLVGVDNSTQMMLDMLVNDEESTW